MIEYSQSLILLACLFIHLRSRKLFFKLSTPFVFILRLSLFIFLLYEENSLFTTGSVEYFNLVNEQSEINFHNLGILQNILFEFKVPFTDYSGSITLSVFTFSTILFFIGFGLFLPYIKRFRYLFLEKQLAIFTFAYLFNFFLSVLLREFFNYSRRILVHPEYVELFIYLLFLLDVLRKQKFMKKKLD